MSLRSDSCLDLQNCAIPIVIGYRGGLINRKQISGGGFTPKESGGILMNDETRKIVLKAWQERKKEEIVHPFLKERIPFGLIPHVQALLLARYLRGDLDAYPPFFWS